MLDTIEEFPFKVADQLGYRLGGQFGQNGALSPCRANVRSAPRMDVGAVLEKVNHLDQ